MFRQWFALACLSSAGLTGIISYIAQNGLKVLLAIGCVYWLVAFMMWVSPHKHRGEE